MSVILDSLLLGLLVGFCVLIGNESAENVFSLKHLSKKLKFKSNN